MLQLTRERIAGFVAAHLHVPREELKDETVLSAYGYDIPHLLDQCKVTYRPKRGLVVEDASRLTFGELVAKLNS